MIKDIYPYLNIKDNLVFGFLSEGNKGIIYKIVIFTLTKEGKWNLAFGDWQNNSLNDKVMTNNQDIVRVIGTVAHLTYVFFSHYPDAIVVIDPVDEKRKKLYNIVFQRHYTTISSDFDILGLTGRQSEVYSPNKVYGSFELSLKSK